MYLSGDPGFLIKSQYPSSSVPFSCLLPHSSIPGRASVECSFPSLPCTLNLHQALLVLYSMSAGTGGVLLDPAVALSNCLIVYTYSMCFVRPSPSAASRTGHAPQRGRLSPNLAASQRTKFHSPRENVERHRPYTFDCSSVACLVYRPRYTSSDRHSLPSRWEMAVDIEVTLPILSPLHAWETVIWSAQQKR